MSQHRNVKSLCEAIERGERPEYVLFWSHTPAKPGVLGKECLSQWYPAPFEAEGQRFPTAEHYMMYRKARLFGDQQIAKQALQVASPGEVKALGRAVRGFDDAVWEEQRFAIVVEGNRAKFSQSAALRSYLIGTKERVLVEASPVDRVWGIGLAPNDKAATNPGKWRGLNLLGFALMEVRAQLLR